MKVRITSAFAARWEEEWNAAGRMSHYQAHGADIRRLEYFIDAFGPQIAQVLKHQLLQALLEDAAALEQHRDQCVMCKWIGTVGEEINGRDADDRRVKLCPRCGNCFFVDAVVENAKITIDSAAPQA